MSRDDRKYSRIYHEAVDDQKFHDVWNDDACLALWVRLLVMADAAWPASSTLPRSAKPRALARLITVGLVDLANGDHFRIHGLDAERRGRHDAAAHAATLRWHADRTADSNANGSATSNASGNAQKRREETRREEVESINVSHIPKTTIAPARGANGLGAAPRAPKKYDELTEADFGIDPVAVDDSTSFAEKMTANGLKPEIVPVDRDIMDESL